MKSDVAPPVAMNHPYCEKFGFNEEKRGSRLALFGLGEADLRLGRKLHNEAIVPHLDQLVEHFYAILLQDREAQNVMARGFELERLKDTLREYLLVLGLDFTEPDYFESRLRIGLAHVWAGVGLALYQGAYRILQQLLIDHLPKRSSRYQALVGFVLKITAFDMSLSVEAYHGAQLESLEDSLESLRGSQAELRQQMATDALTGGLSREHILALLEQQIHEAHERGLPLAVIMADLDHFKAINDEHGHLVGDEVLKDVTRRMQAGLREEDALGRYGGEEFLIVLRGATLDTAREIAERVRERVAAQPIAAEGHLIQMTISQGAAQLHPKEQPDELIDRADQALYEAKENGRNRVEGAP